MSGHHWMCPHSRGDLAEHFREKWPDMPLPPCSCPPSEGLRAAFPRPWRVLDDPSAGLDVVLHPSGFHLLISAVLFDVSGDPLASIARAADAAVAAGQTGAHICEATRSDGRFAIAFLPIRRPPSPLETP